MCQGRSGAISYIHGLHAVVIWEKVWEKVYLAFTQFLFKFRCCKLYTFNVLAYLFFFPFHSVIVKLVWENGNVKTIGVRPPCMHMIEYLCKKRF